MVALPEEIKILLTYLVTQGVKALASLFGKDIAGWGAAVVAVLVGAVLFFLEGILALVPADKQELVASVLAFVAVILGSFGTHYSVKSLA